MFRRVRFTSSVLLKNNRIFSVRSKIRGKPFGLPVNSEIAEASKNACLLDGGAERDRTDDLLLAKQALSQLSYSPFAFRTAATPPRPSRLIGGSGWIRTIDPRLIKTVL
jgi:hypothetical protein